VGPKTVGALYDALGVQDLDDLEAVAREERIREVSGFGPKTEQNILENIEFARQSHERELLGDARLLADRVLGAIRDHPAVEAAETAGSLRRWCPTVGDVDVLAASDESEAVVEAFTDLRGEVIEAGTEKASIRADGMRVDLRVFTTDEWGSGLLYFTGSRDHNISLRNRALKRDLKVNEYGIFDVSDVEDADTGLRVGGRVAGADEEEMYDALDLPWIPPELREDRGEIDAAAAGELPDLVTEDDVRGDLHVHTEWSDGGSTVAEMVAGAAEFGHDYLAVTDHATGPGMVGGVGVPDDRLREQIQTVRDVAADADVRVFTGVEANIGTDGSVSVADDLLADLDCVVASPHAGLGGDGTERLVAAADHPHVNVIGHPTGRLLNQRAGLDVNVERLAEVAAATETALEINADPHRLDLAGGFVKAAVEAGATIAVNTDAHAPGGYAHSRFGVHTARRGWCEPDDVLNTWSPEEVADFLGV
jgi:DNA polymerase (family 10)